MLKPGTHPKIAQERLGHSTISVTLNTYSHVAPGLQQAAAKVLSLISKGRVKIETVIRVIEDRICSGCQLCTFVCTYGAISFDKEKKVCCTNETLCKGCGACVGTCLSHAISLKHFSNEQILAQMEGIAAV